MKKKARILPHKKKICSNCGTLGHSAVDCRRQEKRMMLKRERIAKNRKERMYSPERKQLVMEWGYTKKKWYSRNPPDAQGFYYCHYCQKPLSRMLKHIAQGFDQPTLDHKHPINSIMGEKFRRDLTNLVICCKEDNELKSSLGYRVFCELYYPHLLIQK